MAKKPKALVLGVGAERGIGGAASRRFAKEGYHVLVAGRTTAKIDKVVDTIRKSNGSATAVTVDGTKEDQVIKLFDKATDVLCEQFGCSWDYTRLKIGMTFVLEAHVTYDREVKEGDPFRITTQILDHDAKRIHYMHLMYHGSEGYLAATNELMLMNIDYESRRSAPWPEWAMPRIEKMAAAHARLPRPNQAGRIIGIKRK